MKYIYEITDGKHCYIGQSSASDSNPYTRALNHVRYAYGNAQGDASEPELLAMIRRHNLNKLKINIYEGPNYGFDPQIFQTFFRFLTPYGHRTTVKNYKGSNNVLTSYTSQEVDELMELDAAEILHIANAVANNKIVYNAEMGGAYYGWSLLSSPDVLILEKAFSPDQAKRVLDYIDVKIGNLQQQLDQCFKDWLSQSGWSDFVKSLNITNEKIRRKDLQTLLYEEISNWFWNTSTQSGAFLDFKNYWNKHGPVVPDIELKLRTPTQIQESFATTLAKTFSYQIASRVKRSYPTLQDAVEDILSKMVFTSGRDITFSYAQIIDLKKSGIVNSGWWKQTPIPTKTEQDKYFQQQLKLISIRTMNRFFREVAEPGIYEFRRILVEEPLIAKAEHALPTLSAKIHERYKAEDFTAEFVTEEWTKFYGPMISYIINNKSEWLLIEAEMDRDTMSITYREDKTIPTPQGEAPVGHIVNKNLDDWFTRELSQITVY